MTTAEKIHVAMHSVEVLAVVALVLVATIRLNQVGKHVDQSQQTATKATVDAMNGLKTAIHDNSARVGNLLLAGTAFLTTARTELKPTMESVQDAANSASGTARQATAALKTTQDTIAKLQPLEGAATGEIKALRKTTLTANATLQNVNGQISSDSPYVHNMLASARNILQNASGITSDAYAQYDAWLHPPKCKHFGCRLQRYVLGNLPIAYHAIQAADAAHDLFSGQKIYGSIKVKK